MIYTNPNCSHSKYNLHFHYLACVSYRGKVLTKEISTHLKEINRSVVADVGVTILEQETECDHIHIMFCAKPQIQLSKFLNALKSVSALLQFRKFPEIRKKLLKGSFWRPSYFLVHTGQVTLDILKRCVENKNAKDL